MTDYHVYVFDSGHINATWRIAAANDAEAINRAREIVPGRQVVQIWQERRFVAKLPFAEDE